MQKVVSIRVKNILLHKESVLKVRQNGSLAIFGENRDEILHKESNGSGKTTMIEPFFVCFLGKTSRGCSLKKLIRRGEDSAECEIHLVDSQLIKTEIKVLINRNKPNRVKIVVDGEPIAYLHDMKISHSFEYIQKEVLDISPQDLVDFFLISSESRATFLSSGASNKEAVVSRFSNTTDVDNWVDVIKNKIKINKIDSSKVELELKRNEGEINTILGIIEDNEKLLNKDYQDEDKIKKAQEKEDFYESLCSQNDMELLICQKEIDDSNNTKIIEGSNKINKLKDEVRSIKNTQQELKSNISKANFTLESHHTCPKCKTKFNSSKDDLNLDEIGKYIKYANVKVQDLQGKISLVTKAINISEAEVSEEKRNLNLLKSAYNKKKKELNQNTQSLEAYKKANYTVKNEIEGRGVFKKSLQEKIQLLSEKLTNFEIEKTQLLERKCQLEKSLQKLDFWKSEYGDFKSYLSENALQVIENNINSILFSISNHSLKISETKKTTTGIEKKEINCFVDGNSYNEFSGGEKGRIDVASFIAFRELINSKSSKGLDILIIDEALDKVDSVGIYSIMKTLDKIKVTSLIISHVKVDGENSIKVLRENEQSKLIL